MEKFTKKIKKQTETNKPSIKYDGYLKVIEYKDYEFVSEGDVVIILPYFIEEGFILLRHEPVPTYQYRYLDSTEYKNITHFLTVISGTVEKNESIKNTIRRELYEETGVVLSEFFEINIDKDLFFSKGNSAKYYTCFMEIKYNDYKLSKPKGDGSESEKNSINLKVPLNEINTLKTHDLITDYMLTIFKNKYIKNEN